MTDTHDLTRTALFELGDGLVFEAAIQLKSSGAVIPRPRPPLRAADLRVVVGETEAGEPVEVFVRLGFRPAGA